MTQIKICPDCDTEYYPHIDHCADCGTILLTPAENEKVQEEKKRCRDKVLENATVVREGNLKWLDELSHVLLDSGISCAVSACEGCDAGGCEPAFRLMVSEQDADKAIERIEEYYNDIHPELSASNEMISQGKCPACGYHTGPDAVECPDCGLALLITE